MDVKSRQLRLLSIALVVMCLFGILIIKFYQIQIVENDKWNKVAARQHYFTVKAPFMRGTFYSNNSLRKGHFEEPQAFVFDIEKFHLYIDPESIPNANKIEIIKALTAMLDISLEERIAFKNQFYKKSRSRRLAMWLDKDSMDSILSWWMPYARKLKIPQNALFFLNDYQRSYPYGKLLGQVLHTVQDQKDEKTKQALPTGGLELYFNQHLQGKLGKKRLMRSPRNALEIGEVIANPEHGADIYLTINLYLQAIAEEELAKGVIKAKAKGGWVVMMEPRSGEILALAQYPFFDPKDYNVHFNDPLLIEHTRVKAVTDANEPGSIMKPFTIATALLANAEMKKKGQKEIFDPAEKIDTSNPYFPGRSKPLPDTHFHHYLNLNMGMQKSSNIYMARLVQRFTEKLGNEWYRNSLKDVFGFGYKTGIELRSETSGVLPTIGKLHANGAPEWSKATPFSLAMGYNLQVSCVQMLRAYAVLLNGGYLVQPTLVRKIVKKDIEGKEIVILDRTNPERLKNFPRVLPAEIGQTVSTVMKYTTKPGGTSKRADVWGFTEGGKTGTTEKLDPKTGQYCKKVHITTFVGFTPAVNPAFVMMVVIDEPEYGYIPGIGKAHMGGVCAAPVFREIAKRSLDYLGITPDDPFGYPVGDPRYNSEKADWIPETRKLQELYENWNTKAH